MSFRAPRGIRTVVLIALVVGGVGDARAQRGDRGFGGFGGALDAGGFAMPANWGGNTRYDGRFTFARIKYRGAGMGVGWRHDYPRAESHFMRIMNAITTLHPFVEAGPIVGGNILALDDPELFKYP